MFLFLKCGIVKLMISTSETLVFKKEIKKQKTVLTMISNSFS